MRSLIIQQAQAWGGASPQQGGHALNPLANLIKKCHTLPASPVAISKGYTVGGGAVNQ